MEIIFSLVFGLYILLILACWITWNGLTVPSKETQLSQLPAVSIVIAMRNEAENLPMLWESLLDQDYPKEKIQLILVDDSSEDRSVEVAKNLTALAEIDIKIIELPNLPHFQGSFKKRALTIGIGQAEHPIIITTDADCTYDPQWLRSLLGKFQEQGSCLVSGPVAFLPNRLFGSALIDQEFAALIGIGASFLKWGYPNMCNGANLAFSKKAFVEVDGYQGYEQVISGDDEFLLYKIAQKFPGKVHFAKDPRVVVRTLPPARWVDFMNQRKRWSGKWKFHRSTTTKALALFVFAFHLLWLLAFLLALSGSYPWSVLLVQGSIKLIAEGLFLQSVMKVQAKNLQVPWFLVGQLLYSWYAVFFGIFANIGGYTWKERSFK